MTIVRIDNCSNCKFGEPPGPDGLVECRRYPPPVVMVPAQRPGGQMQVLPAAIFPRLNPALHCGEHKRRIMTAAGSNVIDFGAQQGEQLGQAA